MSNFTFRKCIAAAAGLIVAAGFFTAASAQSGQVPSVSIDRSGISVRDVLKEIEAQTDYTFFYRNDDFDVERTVNIRANDKPITDVVRELLPGALYSIENRKIILYRPDSGAAAAAQQLHEIRGKVSGEDGEPISGATVYLKGNRSVSVVTDRNGEFRLSVPPASTLAVAYIGYVTAEEPVGSRINFDIKLVSEAYQLEQLVVVGYGAQKKVNLTGAVSQVFDSELKDRPVASLSQALQGMVPGLNMTFSSGRPGATGSYEVRGYGSPNSSGQPLILVDGMEINPDRINSNDIESISVLKDAASAAVYGSRATYGVILITTKSGKTDQAPTVNYKGYYSVSSPTTSTDYETRGYYSAKIADTFMMNSQGNPYTSYTEADYQALWDRRNDKTEHPDRPWVTIDKRNGVNQYVYLANFDWYNYLYDDRRPTWDHNLDVSGGSKTLSYMLSGRYYNQAGVQRLNPDNFRSYNFRSKISAELKPWLTLSNNTKFFSSAYNFTGHDDEYKNWRQPTLHALASYVPVNPDGTAVSYHNNTYSASHYLMDGYNAMMHKGRSGGVKGVQEMATKFDAEFRVHRTFRINADFGYTMGYLRNDYRSVSAQYSQYPGVVATDASGSYQDYYQETVWDQKYYAANVFGTYSDSFRNAHNVTVIAGYNYEEKRYKDLKVTRDNLLSEELEDFDVATGDNITLTGGGRDYALMGCFFRGTYNFKERYLLEVNGRYDATSRYLRGHRWGFFPSVAVGYRISEEPFFEPARKVVDNLKVRFSYGSLGNQNLSDYYPFVANIDTGGTMGYTFDGSNRAGHATVQSENDPSLTWETVVHKNLGLDLDMLRNRLSVTADFFIRDTKDIMGEGMELPSIYGDAAPLQNAHDIRTKGYELTLTWRDGFQLAGSRFNYSITGMFSDNTAKYTRVDNASGMITTPYVGKEVGEIWGYRVAGLFRTDEEAADYASRIDSRRVHNDAINGKGEYGFGIRAGDLHYLDLNGDNEISQGSNTFDDKGDREVIGNDRARFFYSGRIGFDWYGVDVSLFFQGIGRQHWYPGADNIRFWGPYSRPYMTFLPENFLADVWSEENPDAYFPRARAYSSLNSGNQLYYTNDRYLQNLAYCRLKNLTVGYTLPARWMNAVRIRQLRVYFSGDNLATWTKLKSDYLDPEELWANSDKKSNVYRWARTFSFGVNLTF